MEPAGKQMLASQQKFSSTQSTVGWQPPTCRASGQEILKNPDWSNCRKSTGGNLANSKGSHEIHKYPDCSCAPIAFWLGQCQEYLKFPDCISLLQISRTQIADDTLQPSCWAGCQENLKFPDSSCLLTGPAASKISSTQIAAAAFYWTCHQTKSPSTQIAVAPCRPLTGPAVSTKLKPQ